MKRWIGIQSRNTPPQTCLCRLCSIRRLKLVFLSFSSPHAIFQHIVFDQNSLAVSREQCRRAKWSRNVSQSEENLLDESCLQFMIIELLPVHLTNLCSRMLKQFRKQESATTKNQTIASDWHASSLDPTELPILCPLFRSSLLVSFPTRIFFTHQFCLNTDEINSDSFTLHPCRYFLARKKVFPIASETTVASNHHTWHVQVA